MATGPDVETRSENTGAPHARAQDWARAFAVRSQGVWRASDLGAIAARWIRRGMIRDELELAAELERARRWFQSGSAHLFACGGRACLERARGGGPLDPAARNAARGGALQVSVTRCQGPCKQAPVATLRVGERCAMFAQVHDVCDWHAVLDYAGRSAAAGTLLVDTAGAQPFLFDPVHDHGPVSVPLRRLAFLIGQFTGEGAYPGRPGSFRKEVVGSWEAGGRFIGLRMAVAYALADGRADVHHALVLVGYDDANARYEARAYTDGGTTRDYRLELDGNAVAFLDRVPGHVQQEGARARKILEPTAHGYREILEIDIDGRPAEVYSRVELRRTDPSAG